MTDTPAGQPTGDPETAANASLTRAASEVDHAIADLRQGLADSTVPPNATRNTIAQLEKLAAQMRNGIHDRIGTTWATRRRSSPRSTGGSRSV